MKEDRFAAEREAYRTKAADLMRKAAEVAARPEHDARAFAELQYLGECGRALDPVASAHADIRQGTIIAPFLIAAGLLLGSMFFTEGWVGLGPLRWPLAGAAAALVVGGMLVVGLTLGRRGNLKAIGQLRGTWKVS